MSQWAVAAPLHCCLQGPRKASGRWGGPRQAAHGGHASPDRQGILLPAGGALGGGRGKVVAVYGAGSGVRAPTPVSLSPHVGPFEGRQRRQEPHTAQAAMPRPSASDRASAAAPGAHSHMQCGGMGVCSYASVPARRHSRRPQHMAPLTCGKVHLSGELSFRGAFLQSRSLELRSPPAPGALLFLPPVANCIPEVTCSAQATTRAGPG